MFLPCCKFGEILNDKKGEMNFYLERLLIFFICPISKGSLENQFELFRV